MGKGLLDRLRALSPNTELAVVVVVAFGFPIATSLFALLHPVKAPLHTNATLTSLLVYEIVVSAALAAFLRIRGWSLGKLGFDPHLWDVGIAVMLFVGVYFVYALFWYATIFLFPSTANAIAGKEIVAHGINVFNVATITAVNPLFEERFVAGYLIAALKPRTNLWTCVNASVAIRLLYHLYQGPLAVISIIPMGLVFALWFARTGRLWPLVVAHALIDAVGLLSVMQ